MRFMIGEERTTNPALERVPNDAVVQSCEDLYLRTNLMWVGLEGKLRTWSLKYGILCGPPILRAPMFFMGANPGGGEEAPLRTTWPKTFEYGDEQVTYKLARFLQDVFRRANRLNALQASTGANLLFFRSSEIAACPEGTGWGNNPPEIRSLLETFCRSETDKLIELLEPQKLFIMGKTVFDRFVPKPHFEVLAPVDRWVAAMGMVKGRVAIGIMHPTGCHWRGTEKEALARYLQDHVPATDQRRTR